MLKITDLVDCKNIDDLHYSEMKSIRGGNYNFGGNDYKPGTAIVFDIGPCGISYFWTTCPVVFA